MSEETGKLGTIDIFSQDYRSTDPATSMVGADEHALLGKRAERCRQVLQLVIENPCSTAGELSRAMFAKWPDLPMSTVVETPHKRLPNLEELGLVERRSVRQCRDSGRDRITWAATTLGLVEPNVN